MKDSSKVVFNEIYAISPCKASIHVNRSKGEYHMTTVKDRSYYRNECCEDFDPDRDMYVIYIPILSSS